MLASELRGTYRINDTLVRPCQDRADHPIPFVNNNLVHLVNNVAAHDFELALERLHVLAYRHHRGLDHFRTQQLELCAHVRTTRARFW